MNSNGVWAMNRLIEEQRTSRRIGLNLLGLGLLACLCSTTARAGSDDYMRDAQTLNPMAYHAAGMGPVVVCGGQTGRPSASLQIRGTDVAAVWHRAYRMLVPRSALADRGSPQVGVNKLPHKGPVWGINLSHGDALVTLQTKW